MDLSLLLSELGPPGAAQGGSRQQRLYERLRRAVLDGTLPPGTVLPGSRLLAAEHGLARNSVMFAYEQLKAEGFLVADRLGTRVAALPIALRGKGTAGAGTPGARFSARAASLDRFPTADAYLPFTGGVPDLNAFPWRAWARLLQQAWGEVSARHLAYSAPGGEGVLRTAIANHLRATRGLACGASQVFITSGAQTALDMCARLLADAGDVAWMEDPGYPAARAVFRAAGLHVVDVPVDPEGMMAMDARRWRRQPPRVVFLTPSHQYPLGSVLSLERRLGLLERARAHGTWLIEDDYDSEFHYGSRQITALAGLAPDAPVVYVGTFSKSLYPALRIGYMVVPQWAVERITAGLQALLRPGQAVEQRALARFIDSGALARHLRAMRERYRTRQQRLRLALERTFGDRIAILGGAAGIHLTVVFAAPVDDVALAARAAALGVVVQPLSAYRAPRSVRRGPAGLLLGYGLADDEMIDSLVERLARAYAATAPAAAAGNCGPT
ncbi:PLP-dependent aminotransferase family protein [Cupriavidus respiraculi]|uniref:MocR-like pyridoxine biosynthesis transcription factor PdxR n=1 Tax=Cupriavidus respiraculi TaxID=195930 RepID=UPI001C958BFA|nr:PLP-dependent aminotransferase family protein [Cupriavidus respiraculi]MBY4947451.1 PLP-dependent aminotransferase family protein [Cupriavidus respiraculi]